jgi:hypothetical protein
MSLTDDSAATPKFQGSWSTDKGSTGSISNTVHFATAPQAGKANTVTFTFNGTEVGLVSTLGPDRGRVTISVDGGAAQTFDLYAAGALQRARLVGSVSGLGSGTHTATVSVLTTRNAASTGTRVDVDAFVVKF